MLGFRTGLSTGTKSLLFGAHQFLLHPIVVTIAWRQLYARWPRPWEALAILVHDWGYWGCPDMDGAQGVKHPARGATIAGWICGPSAADLVAGHSRSYCALLRHQGKPGRMSELAAPDKLSWTFTPAILYLPGAILSGEIHEYREAAADYNARFPGKGVPRSASHRTWFRWLQRLGEVKCMACYKAWVAEDLRGANP